MAETACKCTIGQEKLMNITFGELVNHQQFPKLKPSILVVAINNFLADLLIISLKSLSIHLCKTSLLPNFPVYTIFPQFHPNSCMYIYNL